MKKIIFLGVVILFAMNMRNTNELTAFTSILDYAEQKMV